jgi:hypothetical protein
MTGPYYYGTTAYGFFYRICRPQDDNMPQTRISTAVCRSNNLEHSGRGCSAMAGRASADYSAPSGCSFADHGAPKIILFCGCTYRIGGFPTHTSRSCAAESNMPGDAGPLPFLAHLTGTEKKQFFLASDMGFLN